MKKVEKKEIPIKNYISVLVLFIITILLVIGLRTWYRNYKEYQLTIPVISGKVQEISINEFEDYITEHDDFYLYVGVASDENCRDIEKDLVDLLARENIKNDTVYLNITDLTSNTETTKKELKKYGYNNSSFSYPAFLIIRDKNIIDSVTKDEYDLTLGDIEKLLDKYEIGN